MLFNQCNAKVETAFIIFFFNRLIHLFKEIKQVYEG
jgi:hypothetical protein